MVADLSDKALAVNRAQLALGHEVIETEGAMLVRDRRVPDIWDANHITAVSAATAPDIERLLARVEHEFAGCGHRRFDLDFTTPPAFEAQLALDGYERADFLVMVLTGELCRTATPHDLRVIDDEAGWSAYTALKQLEWQELAARRRLSGVEAVGTALARSYRMKSPPVRYYLAAIGGRPCGYFSAWEGCDGVGQVEDLFVASEFRHRGVATALIERCVADCRAHGVAPIALVCDASDTPKHMYAALGFRPVAVKREYLRRL